MAGQKADIMEASAHVGNREMEEAIYASFPGSCCRWGIICNELL